MEEITRQFTRFAGRAPRDGDVFTEQPTKVFDPEPPGLVAVRQCWQFRNGRWDGFTSVERGATWAR